MDRLDGSRGPLVRLLYLSDNTGDHNRRFLRELARYGLEVWFLNVTADEPGEGWLPAGVQYVKPMQSCRRDAEPNTCEQFVPELQLWLQKLKPDLVQAGPVQSCAYVAALAGFHPLVVMSWGSDLLLDAKRNPSWTHATKIAMRGADGLFCDCDAVRTAAQSFATFRPSQVAQFPWGIERGSFAPEGLVPSQATPWGSDTIPVISTRSWEPVYGIEVLLEAFSLALKRDLRLRLLLLGNGSLSNNVYRSISEHRLENFLSTPGVIPRKDLPGWFRAAKAYISCARSDGTSVGLLEAMATGLPVIVTDIPSNREWVTEGVNGWLSPADSPASFSDNLLRVASLSLEARHQISDVNRRVVAGRADWESNFPQLLNLYSTLTGLPISLSQITH